MVKWTPKRRFTVGMLAVFIIGFNIFIAGMWWIWQAGILFLPLIDDNGNLSFFPYMYRALVGVLCYLIMGLGPPAAVLWFLGCKAEKFINE